MDVLILKTQSGDWEALYIEGKLIDEGHTLGEGDSRLFMLKQAELHGFKSSDVRVKELCDEDEEEVSCSGNLPNTLSELTGSY